MTDYWLSKLFFDLQAPDMLARWRDDPDQVLKDYPLDADVRAAVLSYDFEIIAPRVNAYLLRFFCSMTGMSDPDLLERLHALKPEKEASHG